jgi:hypothetical protein
MGTTQEQLEEREQQITDEAEELFGSSSDGSDPAAVVEPSATPASPTEPSDVEPAEPEAPRFYEIGGRSVPAEAAETAMEFVEWARANPDRLYEFDQYLQGHAQIVLPGQQQQQPAGETDDEELDDWESLPAAVRSRLERMDTIEEMLTGLTEEQARSRLSMASSAIGQARTQFQKTYEISDEDMAAIESEAGALGILPALVRRAGDAVQGTYDTLETAYMRMPQYRSREIGRTLTEHKQAETRQRKASRLTGGSGSVPRTRSTPQTTEEIDAEMADIVRRAMRGEPIDE